MNTVDIITKKRDKYTLTQEEIEYIITGAVDGSIPDYQLSAFLLASFINGLNDEETFYIQKPCSKAAKYLIFPIFLELKPISTLPAVLEIPQH